MTASAASRGTKSKTTLVCFAVKHEAAAFRKFAKKHPNIQIMITGVGPVRAEAAIRKFLGAGETPVLVVSCGFAGGLQPGLARNSLVFNVDHNSTLEPLLSNAGAIPVQVHCSDRVAITGEHKRELRQRTRADVVEMESGAICKVCREYNIPSLMLRVILDTAEDDLPLDFNILMTPAGEIDYPKLAFELVKSPRKIPDLIKLQQHSGHARKKLSEILEKILCEI